MRFLWAYLLMQMCCFKRSVKVISFCTNCEYIFRKVTFKILILMFADLEILQRSYSAKFLVGANSGQVISVKLERTIGFVVSDLGVTAIAVSNVGGSSAALNAITTVMSVVAEVRSDMGVQKRFQATIRDLSSISETQLLHILYQRH